MANAAAAAAAAGVAPIQTSVQMVPTMTDPVSATPYMQHPPLTSPPHLMSKLSPHNPHSAGPVENRNPTGHGNYATPMMTPMAEIKEEDRGGSNWYVVS